MHLGDLWDKRPCWALVPSCEARRTFATYRRLLLMLMLTAAGCTSRALAIPTETIGHSSVTPSIILERDTPKPLASPTLTQSPPTSEITVTSAHTDVPIVATDGPSNSPLVISVPGELHAIAWSPVTPTIAVASTAGAYLYDADSGQLVWSRPASLGVLDVEFAPDGEVVAIADEQVYLLNVENGMTITTLEGHEWATAIAFSSDGRFVATGDITGVILWDAMTGNRISGLTDTPQVYDLVFSSANDKLLVAAGRPYVWNLTSASSVRVLSVEDAWGGAIGLAHMIDDIEFLALFSNGFVTSFGIDDDHAESLVDVGDWAYSIEVYPRKAQLAIGMDDGLIELWDLTSGKLADQIRVRGAWGATIGLAYSHDGTGLAAAFLAGHVAIWEFVD